MGAGAVISSVSGIDLRDINGISAGTGNWGKSDYESAKRRYESKIISLNRRIATIKKSIPRLSKSKL